MELYGRPNGSNGSDSDHHSEWVPVEQEQGSMQKLGLWGSEVYPERVGVLDCSYYIRTGSCGYGANCRFNHPRDRDRDRDRDRGYGGKVQLGGVEFPERMGEPTCQGPVSAALSPGAQPSAGLTSIYGTSQLETSTHAFAGSYLPLPPAPSSLSKTQKEKSFPERPGQPICQFYVKTGDCKFGSSCKFHHPPDWNVSKSNCVISPSGLPLRPGVQPCSFYLLKGFCKFGHTCKFDHPMGTVQYSSSVSSLPDLPIAPYMLRSSFMLAPTLLPDLQAGFVSGSKVDASLSRALLQ